MLAMDYNYVIRVSVCLYFFFSLLFYLFIFFYSFSFPWQNTGMIAEFFSAEQVYQLS